MSESLAKEWPAPAGSVVKVGGIPYALKEDDVLIGCMEPDWSWAELGRGEDQGSGPNVPAGE